MTPEQVSALSNDELNQAMFHLYWVVDAKDEFDKLFNSISPESLNYLSDYNLTMPLVIENNLKVDTHRSEVSAIGHYPTTTNTIILRAACECLVLIALDKKKV